MRICIPTVDDAGLDGSLSPHFGRAPFLTLVDVATGEVEVLANGEPHEHGHCGAPASPTSQPVALSASPAPARHVCGPTAAMLERAPDAVVCRGLGGGAHARLRAAGLRVYLTESWRVAEVLAAFREGRLHEARPELLCRGHGH